MGYPYQQTFRSQQPRNDLAPRFLLRGDKQFVALRLQFRRGFFDIYYVKLNPTLRHEKIAGPLIRAKAGLGRLCQRPQGKMLHAIQPIRMEVAVGLFFERQSQWPAPGLNDTRLS